MPDSLPIEVHVCTCPYSTIGRSVNTGKVPGLLRVLGYRRVGSCRCKRASPGRHTKARQSSLTHYRASMSTATTARGTSGNLPAELTSFVGRRHEVTGIRRMLSASRLVTLTGAGGGGK